MRHRSPQNSGLKICLSHDSNVIKKKNCYTLISVVAISVKSGWPSMKNYTDHLTES